MGKINMNFGYSSKKQVMVDIIKIIKDNYDIDHLEIKDMGWGFMLEFANYNEPHINTLNIELKKEKGKLFNFNKDLAQVKWELRNYKKAEENE